MLFTEQELNITNAMAILEDATYLSEDESLINPKTVPVTEVSRLGYGVVRFDDVDKLSECYGCDYIDAMYAIAEASDINPEYLAVSVPEEDIIAYPEIVNELANIVIQPLSEYDDEYQYVAECVNGWLESGDEEYLGLLLEMTQQQWDYVNGLADLSQQQKNAIGKRFYGKDVDTKTLQKEIHRHRRTGNGVSRTVHQNARGIKKVRGDKSTIPGETIANGENADKLKSALSDNRTRSKFAGGQTLANLRMSQFQSTPFKKTNVNDLLADSRRAADTAQSRFRYADTKIDKLTAENIKNSADVKNLIFGLNNAVKEGNISRAEAENLKRKLATSEYRVEDLRKIVNQLNAEGIKARGQLTDEKVAHNKTKEELTQSQKTAEERQNTIDQLNTNIKKSAEENAAYKNKGLHRVADKLYAAGDWVKNNKGKTALGVGLGAAAIGGGIYAYKQYKNKPKSVIGKRIAALRSIYKKFMLNAQRNPQKANIFKRMAAKILSVIDKLMAFMQNAAG